MKTTSCSADRGFIKVTRLQETIKVLVVGGSAVARRALTTYINSHDQLEVIGFATDLSIALRKLERLKPDIITLDIHLDNIDNADLLKQLAHAHPIPIFRVCSHSTPVSKESESIELTGTLDFSFDPSCTSSAQTLAAVDSLCTKLLRAAAVTSGRQTATTSSPQNSSTVQSQKVATATPKPANAQYSTLLLAIGASTGGVNALKEVLSDLPADTPGTVIVQHIPGTFSGPLAKKLNSSSAMQVKEAEHGERILQGHAYLAPGDQHLSVTQRGPHFICELSDAPPYNRHRPSVDVLFNSVAECSPKHSIGIILTGMGRDGAEGLLRMKTAGSPTIAQDEESSIVWGMPGSAVALGAADYVMALDKVADGIRQLFALNQAA